MRKERLERFWSYFGTLVGVIVIVALLLLAGVTIYKSWNRGQDRRAAENNTKIERELTTQDALRQYRSR